MLVWEEESTPSTPHSTSTAPTSPQAARAMPSSPSFADPVVAHAPLQAVASASVAAAKAQAPLAASSVQSASKRRVNVADKRIINGQTDVNLSLIHI